MGMNNNDVIRRVRYTFDFNDDKMIELFKHNGLEVTRAQVSAWLKKDDDPEQVPLKDLELATFLNGLIIEKRGKKEGVEMIPERQLNNNQIFRKLRIALNLKDVDILKLYDLVDIYISEHELSAFFRKPSQRQYRACQDQFLRNFLKGMQLKYRDNK